MLDQTISLFCLSLLSGTYNPACNQAGKAFVIQTNVQSNYNLVQDNVINKVKDVGSNTVGKTGEITLYTAYELGYRRRLSVPLDLGTPFTSFRVIGDFRSNTVSFNLGCNLNSIFKLFDKK